MDHAACALLASLAVLTAVSTRPSDAASSPQHVSSTPSATPTDTATVTHHVAVIGGRPIRYTATAGTIEVTGLGDRSRARLFHVA